MLNILTIKRIILRSLKRPVKTFRTIAVMGGHVVPVREGVLAVVVRRVEGADSPEGGVEEDSVVVAEDRVHCGAPNNLDSSTLFIGCHLL